MRRSLGLILLSAVLLFGSSKDANGQDAISSLRQGTPILNLRLRGEGVRVDGVDDDSGALTLRTAFGFRSGAYRGVSFLVEGEAITAPFGDDGYRNAGAGALNNGVTDRPVVADPVSAGVNQAWLRWAGSSSAVTVGRQEIIFDDARFVGNVGWRQNHQSFDAVRLDYSAGTVAGSYAFIREVHRITGQQLAMRGHVARAGLPVGSVGTVSAVALSLDYPDLPALSATTLGGSFAGEQSLGHGTSARYGASYATQQDAHGNPADFSSTRLAVYGGVQTTRFGARLLYERLSGDGERGFATPLATLHAFNGWADQFLGTPAEGLVDRAIELQTTLGAARVMAVFHDFIATSNSDKFGRELDVQVLYTTASRLTVGVKAAHYVANDRGANTTKAWLWGAIGL